MSLAQFIDHTILKPSTTLTDIEKVCSEAMEYHFAAVCIPPYFVPDAFKILEGSKVKLATVIGFPFGYSDTSAKLAEAEKALSDGADELDMVMNLAAFFSNDLAYLENEMSEMLRIKEKKVLKLIIESGLLSREDILKCCRLFGHYPLDFMKTSTGYAEKGASTEAVQLMRAHLPSSIRIKASGGIRTAGFAQELINAGATRLGCSASLAIVKGEVHDPRITY
jgi:deoxyribose-phosphate aldolase